MRPGWVYTHNAHPCFEWYTPSRSPILRELLKTCGKWQYKWWFFVYFWKIKGMNLQNNCVWRMVHHKLMYERGSWMGLSVWTFFMPSGINNRSCTQSHSWTPNLGSIFIPEKYVLCLKLERLLTRMISSLNNYKWPPPRKIPHHEMKMH